MKFHLISILFIFAFSIQCFGQTKMIFHKSHSGSEATFSIALNHTILDLESSNFGLGPDFLYEKNVFIDSVIFVSPTQIVIISSNNLFNEKHIDTINTPYCTPDLDIIRADLSSITSFDNSIDSIKFIGYYNDIPTLQKLEPIFIPFPKQPEIKSIRPTKVKKIKSKRQVKKAKKEVKKQPKKEVKKQPKKEVTPPIVIINVPPPPNSNFPLLSIIFGLGFISILVGLRVYWKNLTTLNHIKA